ncbi:MAG: cation transporter, partial [Coxiellaceae bacterium]|nr:cation transporter [Coxiellaceae bacterium]
MDSLQIKITGMKCASCVASIEAALNAVPGVDKAQVNFAARSATVVGHAELPAVIAAIEALGYEAALMDSAVAEDESKEEDMAYWRAIKKTLVAALVGLPLFLDLFFSYLPSVQTTQLQWSWVSIAVVVLLVMAYAGSDIYRSAWSALKSGHSNMHTLVSIGTGMAWLYSAVVVFMPAFLPVMAQHVYFDTAVILMAFINFGAALEVR